MRRRSTRKCGSSAQGCAGTTSIVSAVKSYFAGVLLTGSGLRRAIEGSGAAVAAQTERSHFRDRRGGGPDARRTIGTNDQMSATPRKCADATGQQQRLRERERSLAQPGGALVSGCPTRDAKIADGSSTGSRRQCTSNRDSWNRRATLIPPSMLSIRECATEFGGPYGELPSKRPHRKTQRPGSNPIALLGWHMHGVCQPTVMFRSGRELYA